MDCPAEMEMSYQEQIWKVLGERTVVDLRHVEAWMRDEHGTLDHLTPEQFEREVGLAAQFALAQPELSERLAQSYGL